MSDSDGVEKDRVRLDSWRWRDWVIDAFNADQPFDQFTIEQIAGDLLPNATPLQTAANGFHRNTLLNREGGVDHEEDRWKRTIDRAATVAESLVGADVGMHPVPQPPLRRYQAKGILSAVAFFNNADDDIHATTRSIRTSTSVRIQVPSTADPHSPLVPAYYLPSARRTAA